MPTTTSITARAATPDSGCTLAASGRGMRLLGALALSLALVLTACGGTNGESADAGAAPGDGLTWPGTSWATATPAEMGLDEAALADMVSAAEAGGSSCLAVTRQGKLVGDWYWNGQSATSTLEAFSATKSISSTLVGIAADQGLIDIDAPASTWVTEWAGTPSAAVTVRDLLSNDSGRFYDFTTDYVDMAVGAADKTAFAIGLSQQWEPDTHWDYNNSAIQVLDAVISRATGMSTREFAAQNLFGPIGARTVMKPDPAGNTMTFMGAETSCLDLARFGLLFARDGAWDGTQVVSAEWVAEATRPSQQLNPGYGFLWWLTGGGSAADPDGQGASDDQGVPTGTFAALGLGGQVVLVDPATDTVVVRMARLGNEDFGVDDMGAWLSRADAR